MEDWQEYKRSLMKAFDVLTTCGYHKSRSIQAVCPCTGDSIRLHSLSNHVKSIVHLKYEKHLATEAGVPWNIATSLGAVRWSHHLATHSMRRPRLAQWKAGDAYWMEGLMKVESRIK